MKIRNLLLITTLVPLSLWLIIDGSLLPPGYLQKFITPLSIQKDTVSTALRSGHGSGSAHSSTAASSDEEGHDKPLFVLHIGPPKTGTSTIQGYAREYEELLELDNIYYPGHDAKKPEKKLHELSKFCRKCDIRDCSQCDERWMDFERVVNDHFDQGHDVFVSDETFNRFFSDDEATDLYLWTRLKSILSRWNVRIVVTYRHYYEWLPSTYFQSFGPDWETARSHWPEDGGGTTPTFPDFFESFAAANDHKLPATILKKWQEHFLDVRVFNMHNNQDFGRPFYCEMLPEAIHLCDHLTLQPTTITKNPSTSKAVQYDMLAVAAHQQGLVNNKTLSRPEVAEAVKERAQNLGLFAVTDFAHTCLTKDQAGLFLNMSLHFESQIAPDFHLSNDGAPQHKANFNEMIKGGKFCSINTEEVLKDESWQSFFKNLGTPTKQSKEMIKTKDKVKKAVTKANEVEKPKELEGDESNTKRRTPMLCLYTGDEGSTVLSEALRNHPQVYSPDWKVEPANVGKLAKRGESTLEAQLDAIRFLLQMPSNTTIFGYRKNPMSLESYDGRMGDAEATYLKVAVCRDARHSTKTWSACLEKVLSNLLCGEPGETVQHLILPIRYGFDRACSIFVHRDKEMYTKFSQFGSAGNSESNSSLVSITEKHALGLQRLMQRYITNFMQVVRVAQESCPGQQHRVKLHVFDYDLAKQVGIDKALEGLFADLGLRHSHEELDLGRFGQRKPGNYCERIFDSKSKKLLREKEADYKKWLKSTCSKTPTHAWCVNEKRT